MPQITAHTDGQGQLGPTDTPRPLMPRPIIENFEGSDIELAEAIDSYYSNTQ